LYEKLTSRKGKTRRYRYQVGSNFILKSPLRILPTN
jgi:hypothetical protein